MPIHFEDLEVLPEVEGLSSALIIPCIMCPAATVAMRENKPFLQLFRSVMRSPPFEKYLITLKSRLNESGVKTDLFKSDLYHHWFMCMWTEGRRKQLGEQARQYDAAIVLGCDSATQTVRDSLSSTECKVIEGMRVAGIMNAKLKFHLPCNISFEECKIVPISQKDQA